jgi:hypothetical protein
LKRTRFASVTAAAGLIAATLTSFGSPVSAETYSPKPGCQVAALLCTEVADPKPVFGNYYVGHDEPSVLFYSNVPGSGNHMQYQLTMPSEPTGAFSQTKGYDFELHPAFWFGMAMCDTQSFPEQSSHCTPDSDSNIVNPANGFTGAPGAAFEELQFYPPGWVPQFAGSSCDPTKWCAALNIDSLGENPINGKLLNPACQSQILGGAEYINFAFLTLNGSPLGPPNPLQFDASTSGDPTFDPANGSHDGANTFFMNQGDQVTVALTDTPNGLATTVVDHTSGQTGTMVASAANGFGQIKFQPGGHSCQMLPYSFHPMYSTSGPSTRVLWAAHGYNVAFSDEIGHFDFCTAINANTGNCSGQEGIPSDLEAADADDGACFGAAQSLLYPSTGCEGQNVPGFDGVGYQQGYWPDSTSLAGPSTVPSPIRFSAPLTGSAFRQPYSQLAFETDLPRNEATDLGGQCQRFLNLPNPGQNCVNPPTTDDGTAAPFYPYFTQLPGPSCDFVEGANFATGNSFGGNSTAEFGPLLALTYWTFGGHGATNQRYNNFNSGPITNSC